MGAGGSLRRDAFSLEEHAGLNVFVCDALRGIDGLGHAFSTRKGPGDAPFDLGAHDAVGQAFERRRRLLCAAAGLAGQRLLALHQVHGADVLSGALASDHQPSRADGVVCLSGETPGLVPAVRTADCVPILLASGDGRAAAALHAGWQGTAAKIAMRGTEALTRRGVPPAELVAAIGPSIGSCCYEVDHPVAEVVARSSEVPIGEVAVEQTGRSMLDLPRANAIQLERAGLRPSAIHVADRCTACHEELFFSYRRDGGPTGRMMACIGWV